MRDTTVDTQLRLLTLQMESWKKLHDFVTYALDKAKPIVSAEQERQFTEVRSVLLQESEHVFTELGLVTELSGKTMNVLQRATSIRGVRESGPEEARRLEIDWNAVFTKMGLLQGQLKAKRRELLNHSAMSTFFARVFGRKVVPARVSRAEIAADEAFPIVPPFHGCCGKISLFIRSPDSRGTIVVT